MAIEVHGARIHVPADWDDVSIYRFLPPDDPAPVLLSAKQPRRAQPNVVITRHALAKGDGAEQFLEVINTQALAENRSFRVLSSGTGDYLGQVIRWQETQQTATESALAVHQRQITLPGHEGELVLVTITGDRKQVAAMAAALGFE